MPSSAVQPTGRSGQTASVSQPAQPSARPPSTAPRPGGTSAGPITPNGQAHAYSPTQHAAITSTAAPSSPQAALPASVQSPGGAGSTTGGPPTIIPSNSSPPATTTAAAAVSKPQPSPPAPGSRTQYVLLWLFTQLFYLLWLVPATALIVLNMKGHIIGASAWCPYGKCNINIMVPASAWPKTSRFDGNNHNLLGVLQLVAKALEVWFVSITVALAYKITMRLASRPAGLPLLYLVRPEELTEISALFKPTLWSIARPAAVTTRARPTQQKILLYLFLSLTAILCILCNLMGPAIAVLVLPTLQWRQVANISDGYINGVNSEQPPYFDGFAAASGFGQCTSIPFPYNLSCSSRTAWDKTFANSLQSIDPNNPEMAISYGGVSVYTNTTRASGFWDRGEGVTAYWIPSLQAISQMSLDTTTIQEMESNSWTYSAPSKADELIMPQFNKSLEMQLLRSGPVVGSYVNVWAGNEARIKTTIVDANRKVRCYEGYLAGVLPLSGSTFSYRYLPGTRCIQVGTGWGTYGKIASFSVSVLSNADSVTNSVLDVNIYSSGRTTFWPRGERPVGVGSDCFAAAATDNVFSNGAITSTQPAPTARVSVVPVSGCVPLQDPDEFANGSVREGCNCDGVQGLLPFFRDQGSDLCGYTAITVTGTSTSTVLTGVQDYGPTYTPWHTIRPSCDWEAFWKYTYEPPIKGLDIQSNVTTVEMTLREDNMTSTLAVDFNAFFDTVTYSLDPAYLDHPSLWALPLSQPKIGAPMHLDPSWVLAAWSVSNNSALPADAVAGQALYNQLKTLLNSQKEGYTSGLNFSHGWAYEDYATIVQSPVVLPPVIQVLSLLDFWTSTPEKMPSNPATKVGQSLLWHSGRIYVWAYGMSSRTSRLGVTVVIAGMLVVIGQCIMSATRRIPSKDLTQFLAAALAQVPHGEFDHTKSDPDKIAATDFRVRHSDTQIGNLEYHKVP